MPELPEVETIRRQLAPHLEGRTLERVEILDPRWTRPVAPAEVEDQLRGRQVIHVGRHGKYLVWELDHETYLISHLRMTGSFLLDPEIEPTHTRVRMELGGGHRLIYVDPRRFGTGEVVHSEQARDEYLRARLGVEPMTPQFTAGYLRAATHGRTAPIKSFILDQRRISGVGNIYADEALWRARIHPLRPAGSLRGGQFAALREGIEEALCAGIESKGATIDDFRHLDGAYGSFQDQFLVHLRRGEPCYRCATTIKKLVVGGRGTYVCEHCQPRPRPRRPRLTTASPAGSAR